MPAAYTHYKFGQEVLYHLSDKKVREIIAHYPKMYDLGLYGPDILFYYGLPGRIKRNYMGFALHKEIAAFFFERSKLILLSKDNRARAAGLSYMFGMICHFALDSQCHSLVQFHMERDHLSHTEMEMDLERELLVRDGKNPISYNPVHIRLMKKEAEQVASFYEGVTAWEIAVSLQHMKRVTGWLLPTNMVKKGTLHSLLGATGHYRVLRGLIMKATANAACGESTQNLLKRFDEAMPIAVALMVNYYHYVLGKEGLSPYFNRTYGADSKEVRAMWSESTS